MSRLRKRSRSYLLLASPGLTLRDFPIGGIRAEVVVVITRKVSVRPACNLMDSCSSPCNVDLLRPKGSISADRNARDPRVARVVYVRMPAGRRDRCQSALVGVSGETGVDTGRRQCDPKRHGAEMVVPVV